MKKEIKVLIHKVEHGYIVIFYPDTIDESIFMFATLQEAYEYIKEKWETY